MEKFSFKDVLVTFAGLLITAFIAWVLISATGNNPSEVALYLYEGGFKGTRNIANSLYQATPLILTAVATLISFRVGMFNIGIKKENLKLTKININILCCNVITIQ